MLPPSTVIAVLLESPPRIETENSELYCEVEPGLAVTPGSRNASCRKLRPLSGSSWIFCRVITPLTACASVSTWMAVAATVTVSVASPSSMRMIDGHDPAGRDGDLGPLSAEARELGDDLVAAGGERRRREGAVGAGRSRGARPPFPAGGW